MGPTQDEVDYPVTFLTSYPGCSNGQKYMKISDKSLTDRKLDDLMYVANRIRELVFEELGMALPRISLIVSITTSWAMMLSSWAATSGMPLIS